MSVILTPAFEGNVWYEKKDNKIIFYGEKEGEVSFLLSAPRFDVENWPNLIENEDLEGLKVPLE